MADFNERNEWTEEPRRVDMSHQVMPEGYVRRRRSDRHKSEAERTDAPVFEAEEDAQTRVMPSVRAQKSVDAQSTRVMPVQKKPEQPLEENPYRRPAQESVRTYGEETRYQDNRYKASQAQLDQDLYPEDNNEYDDYDEYDDDEPPRRVWPVILVCILLVLLLFVAGLIFLPKLMARPEDNSGVAGTLYSIRDSAEDVLEMVGIKEEPAGIHLFQTSNTAATVGNEMKFSITTTKAVQNVRVQDETGAELIGTVQCKDAPSNTTWVVSVRFDAPFTGNVYAALCEDNEWHLTESMLTLLVTAPTPTPTMAPTPTPTIAPTQAPTQAPTNEPVVIPAVTDAPTDAPVSTAFVVPATVVVTPTPTPTQAPTQAPTATPTPTPTPTPVPTNTPMPILEAGASDAADPSKLSLTQNVYVNGKSVSDLERETAINMNGPDAYNAYEGGVFAFRNNSFRQNAAFSTVEVTEEKLSVEWKYQLGSLRTADNGTLYGVGWTGQPAIVKWASEARNDWMNLYEEKRNVKALKEVIFGALDGKIYFLDLNDGQPTRDPITLGYPIKSSVAMYTRNSIPMLGVGQAISKLANKTGDIGYYLYNLMTCEEMLFINGRKSNSQSQYATNGAFDGSGLFDRDSDSLIIGGENGLVYTVALNSVFEYDVSNPVEKPPFSINKEITFLKTKSAKEKDTNVSIETSLAMYDKYIYSADAYGILQCIDSDTMKAVWAVDVGDNTDAALALDFDKNGDLGLYTGNTSYARLKGKTPVTIRRLDALTGEEVWAYEINCVYNADQLSGVKASPVMGENEISDLVIFTVNMTGDKNSATILALNKLTGKLVWKHELESTAISSPVAVYNEAGEAWIIQADQKGRLYLLDGTTGDVRNVLDLKGEIQASPAVYKDMLVIGTCSKDNAYMYGIRIQ